MPKEPKDHRPKKAAATPEERTVEVQGLTLTVTIAAFDDFELMGDLRKIDRGDDDSALLMPEVLKALVGPNQYKAVLDHLRRDNGRVGIEDGARFIGDLLRAYNPNS